MPDVKSNKDAWDKLDIFIKFFNGFILAGLTFAVSWGSYHVANSIKYGELSQKMLGDLTTPISENKIRRDLALIVLNETIGNDQPDLISEIAEVIYLNDSVSQKEKGVAFRILKIRRPSEADSLLKIATANTNLLLQDTTTRMKIISSPQLTADNNPVMEINNTAVQALNLSLAQSFSTVVYIQTNNKDKQKLKPLADYLKQQNYKVPSIETIHQPFENSIRFFNAADAIKAKEIADEMKRMNPKWECKIEKLPNPDNKVPAGQVEVWINLK